MDLTDMLESERVWKPASFGEIYEKLTPRDRQALLVDMIGQKLPGGQLDPNDIVTVQEYIPQELVDAAAHVDPSSLVSALEQYGFMLSECFNCHKLSFNGEWLTLGISVDPVNGISLSIDNLPGEDAEQLKQWLEPILNTVDADVLVTDDADAFKNG